MADARFISHQKDDEKYSRAQSILRSIAFKNEIVANNVSRGGKRPPYDYEQDEDFEEEVDEAMAMYQMYPALRYDIKSYVNLIKEEIIGQDDAIKKLVYVGYMNQFLNFVSDYMVDDYGKRKVLLLIAPTGNGKTAMMRAFEKAFEVPVYIANVTATTSSGYVGEDVEDLILGLYARADYDLEKAQRGVLFIDEIDKKAAVFRSGERDIVGKSVQQELLKILEPGHINITQTAKKRVVNLGEGEKISFDTSYLTVILGGAFVGLDDIRKERLNKHQIGFVETEEVDKTTKYTHEDLINYGFIPEFVGRIDMIEEFRKLNTEDIIQILYSENSSFQKNVKLLHAHGIKHVEFNGLLSEKIARVVEKSSMGVRALNNMIGELFAPVFFEVFQHLGDGILYIDENGRYELSYGDKRYTGCGLDMSAYD